MKKLCLDGDLSVMTAHDFAALICHFRHFGPPFSVTSWFRSAKRNAQVGGHPKSKHLVGLGLDIVLDDPKDKPKMVETLRAIGLSALDEGDHLHIQPMRGK